MAKKVGGQIPSVEVGVEKKRFWADPVIVVEYPKDKRLQFAGRIDGGGVGQVSTAVYERGLHLGVDGAGHSHFLSRNGTSVRVDSGFLTPDYDTSFECTGWQPMSQPSVEPCGLRIRVIERSSPETKKLHRLLFSNRDTILHPVKAKRTKIRNT